MIFYWSLSENKSPQVSRTLLSILADLNNEIVWMVSTFSVISTSSSLCTSPSVTEQLIRSSLSCSKVFFQFPCKVEVIIILFTFFQFHSVVSRDNKVHYSASYLFFCWLLLGLVVLPGLGDPFVCQNFRGVCVSHFPRQKQGCAYTICLYGQISISCTIPSGSSYPPSRVVIII